MYVPSDIDDKMGYTLPDPVRRGVVGARPVWDWAAVKPNEHNRTNERGGAPESVYQRATRAVDEAERKR